MALTAYKIVTGSELVQLRTRVKAEALIGPKQCLGPALYNADERVYMQTMVGGAAPTVATSDAAMTDYNVIAKPSIDELEVAVLALGDTWLLHGPAQYNMDDRLYTQTVLIGGIAGGVAAV